MKYEVVTIGDASEDIFVRPRDMHVINDRRFVTGRGASFELGEKILLDDVKYEVGGSACNNAVAFSRQGYKTAAIIAIGDDTPGKKIEEKLILENVDVKYLKRKKEYKTNFSVVFNIGDERTIFIYHGLSDYSCLVTDNKLSTEWVFLAPLGEGDDFVISKIVNMAAEKNVKVAWNPGGVQIKKTAQHYKNILACTSILFLNREEAIKFINLPVQPEAHEVMKALHNYGVKIVVITDGKKGATAYDGQKFYHADIISSDRVDATGAGDSFATGFSGKIMESDEIDEKNIIEALKWGIVNSTSVVSFIGAQHGLLTKDGIAENISKEYINIVSS